MDKTINIIESASEIGAGKPGSSLGPRAVRDESVSRNLTIFDTLDWYDIPHKINNISLTHSTPDAKKIELLLPIVQSLSNAVENVLKNGCSPLIFSGDHSNAIGTVAGIKNFIGDKKLGVIWVDAHLDLHSPYTTPSGNIHGMALNASLAMDNAKNGSRQPDEFTIQIWNELKQLGDKKICPKIKPEHVVFIGIRSFEAPEEAIIKQENMKIYYPEDIKQSGIINIINQSLHYLADCDYLYVSFDVDSMDTSISVGTGTPVQGGLMFEEAEEVFKSLFYHPKVIAFEITEINPLLDTEKPMAAVVTRLLQKVL